MLDLRHLHLVIWPLKVPSLSLQRQSTKGQKRSKQQRCGTFSNSRLQLSHVPNLQHLLCCFFFSGRIKFPCFNGTQHQACK